MSVMIMKKPCYGYSKLDKEDPEEIVHRRAQFLIYKALKQADSTRESSNFPRIRLCKLKIKIGRKLKRTRKSMLLSISAARIRVYKQIANQWKRLFSSGGANAIASLPTLLALS